MKKLKLLFILALFLIVSSLSAFAEPTFSRSGSFVSMEDSVAKVTLKEYNYQDNLGFSNINMVIENKRNITGNLYSAVVTYDDIDEVASDIFIDKTRWVNVTSYNSTEIYMNISCEQESGNCTGQYGNGSWYESKDVLSITHYNESIQQEYFVSVKDKMKKIVKGDRRIYTSTTSRTFQPYTTHKFQMKVRYRHLLKNEIEKFDVYLWSGERWDCIQDDTCDWSMILDPYLTSNTSVTDLSTNCYLFNSTIEGSTVIDSCSTSHAHEVGSGVIEKGSSSINGQYFNYSFFNFSTAHYIQINDTAELEMGVENFSVSVWVNTTTSDNMRIVNKWDGASFGWQIGMTNAEVYTDVRGSAGSEKEHRSGYPINNGSWHHIVLVRNRGSNISTYANGVLLNWSTDTSTDLADHATLTTIGRASWEADEACVNCAIDDLRIFKGVGLTTQQVKDMYISVSANTPPTHTTPILNASDSPFNYSEASITVYNQSTEDVDGDPLTNRIKWFKGGVEQTGLENLTSLNSDNTSAQQDWIATICPHDGTEFGTCLNSSTLSIRSHQNVSMLNFKLDFNNLLIDSSTYSFFSNSSVNFTNNDNVTIRGTGALQLFFGNLNNQLSGRVILGGTTFFDASLRTANSAGDRGVFNIPISSITTTGNQYITTEFKDSAVSSLNLSSLTLQFMTNRSSAGDTINKPIFSSSINISSTDFKNIVNYSISKSFTSKTYVEISDKLTKTSGTDSTPQCYIQNHNTSELSVVYHRFLKSASDTGSSGVSFLSSTSTSGGEIWKLYCKSDDLDTIQHDITILLIEMTDSGGNFIQGFYNETTYNQTITGSNNEVARFQGHFPRSGDEIAITTSAYWQSSSGAQESSDSPILKINSSYLSETNCLDTKSRSLQSASDVGALILHTLCTNITLDSALDFSAWVDVQSGETIDILNISMSSFDVTQLDVTAENDPPQLIALVLNSTDNPSNLTDADLKVNFTTFDPDGDTITFKIDWFTDGSVVSELENQTTIDSASTEKGEVWIAQVTLNDGTVDGPKTNSSSLTILDSNISLTLDGPANASNSLVSAVVFTYTGNDADKEDINYTLYVDTTDATTVVNTSTGAGDTQQSYTHRSQANGTTLYWRVQIDQNGLAVNSSVRQVLISTLLSPTASQGTANFIDELVIEGGNTWGQVYKEQGINNSGTHNETNITRKIALWNAVNDSIYQITYTNGTQLDTAFWNQTQFTIPTVGAGCNKVRIYYNITLITSTSISETCPDTPQGTCTVTQNFTTVQDFWYDDINISIPTSSLQYWNNRQSIDVAFVNNTKQTDDALSQSIGDSCNVGDGFGTQGSGDGSDTEGFTTKAVTGNWTEGFQFNPTAYVLNSGFLAQGMSINGDYTLTLTYGYDTSLGGSAFGSTANQGGGGGGGVTVLEEVMFNALPSRIDVPVLRSPTSKGKKEIGIETTLIPTACEVTEPFTCEIRGTKTFAQLDMGENKLSETVSGDLIIFSGDAQIKVPVTFRVINFGWFLETKDLGRPLPDTFFHNPEDGGNSDGVKVIPSISLIGILGFVVRNFL